MREIKNILRELREDGDYKQYEIAKVIGVNQQYYSKYETGEYEIPVRHLITLSKFYHVSMDYLTGLTRFKMPHDELYIKMAQTNVSPDDLLSRVIMMDDYKKTLVVEYVKWLESRGSK